MFQGPFDHSIIKRANEKGLVEINFVDIRNFGIGKHKTVDDKPYGGGTGMILKVDVLKAAIDKTKDETLKKDEEKIALLSAKGENYTQTLAQDFSKLKHLILICGHYEGVDERIVDFIDYEISIGDFVLTGGEIAAMLITDSTARLIPGVLKKGVVENESHSEKNLLEYPHYTRPDIFEGKKVPQILLKGNHKKIDEWKNKNKKLKTKGQLQQNP
jgi:tRNA (guanine37-N1)-methyltransferase